MRRRTALRLLISSGPTREPLDAVRFLSNASTGYLGARLAEEALRRGHRVTVISGPSAEPLPAGARVIAVQEARAMERAMRRHAASADAIIMAAAVSDFRPARVSPGKLRRRGGLVVRLSATPDIVARLPRRAGQVVAGCAVEIKQVVPRARRKLLAKRLDLLLAQRVEPGGAPFGRRSVRAWLLARSPAPPAPGTRRAAPKQRARRPAGVSVLPLGRVSKPRAARALLDKLEALWYGQQRSGPHVPTQPTITAER
jgi:phosphopantothenoylcysteine decarboxylase/phosphopantothenate--cysteine ligase